MSATASLQQGHEADPANVMQAIVCERYGVDALALREVARPRLEADEVLVRVHASSVNPVDWYRVTGPVFARFPNAWRKPGHTEVGGDLAGQVEAVGGDVEDLQPGDEVFGTTVGAWAEDRGSSRGAPRAQACEPVVRGGGGRPHRRDHRPAGTARPRRPPAGAEGPDQRRLWRRGHVCGPDRQVPRSGSDRGHQHEEPGSGPLARRGPGDRLHAGGLHPAWRAP